LRKISLALADADVAGLERVEQGFFGHCSVIRNTLLLRSTFVVASDNIRAVAKAPAEFIVSGCFDGLARNRWQQLAWPRDASFARHLWQCPFPH